MVRVIVVNTSWPDETARGRFRRRQVVTERGYGGVGNGKTGSVAPSREAILAAAAALGSSKALAGSVQLQRLLAYVVEHTLAGNFERLKESVLGVEVFDRPADYDPRTDPIVRVQARRLRARLDDYYRDEGRSGAVRIELPKGSYVATFAAPAKTAAPVEARRVPRAVIGIALAVAILAAAAIWLGGADDRARAVAVLPLLNLTGDPSQEWIADKLTESLITELARHPELQVRSRTTVMQYKGVRRPLPEIATELGVQTVVEGGVVLDGDHLTLKTRAVDARRDVKTWARSVRRPRGEMADLASDLARQLGPALLQKTMRP